MAELKFIGGYPEYMRKLIDVVNQTRPKRKDYIPKAMTMQERDEVLKVHPDYAPGGKRTISIGPNKGDAAPNEVADLLEAYPLITSKEIDPTKPDFSERALRSGHMRKVWQEKRYFSSISCDTAMRILLWLKVAHKQPIEKMIHQRVIFWMLLVVVISPINQMY